MQTIALDVNNKNKLFSECLVCILVSYGVKSTFNACFFCFLSTFSIFLAFFLFLSPAFLPYIVFFSLLLNILLYATIRLSGVSLSLVGEDVTTQRKGYVYHFVYHSILSFSFLLFSFPFVPSLSFPHFSVICPFVSFCSFAR